MTSMNDELRSHMLIETHELEPRLDDPSLRIIDCDIVLTVKPDGGYDVQSGRPNWEQAHIPNSIYVHIGAELSSDHPTLRYMLPTAEHFANTLSQKGIGSEHHVVLYARGANYWATRLYLMFREFGAENVRVLNGGWDAWADEGRPTTTDVPRWPPAQFSASPPAASFVDKNAVLAALENEKACVINALSPALHSGEMFSPAYGRPGHITGSVNVFFMDLIDPQTKRFLDAPALRERFGQVGALDADPLITYCGGGISATVLAFALHLLGRTDVRVYDGSLSEWGNDPDLPMTTG